MPSKKKWKKNGDRAKKAARRPQPLVTSKLNRKSVLSLIFAIGILLVITFLYTIGSQIRFRSEVAAGKYKDANILLITVDTLRADHLPVHGYKKLATPNLDDLAKRSMMFENAFSHTPLTLPAHTSIMTGMLPVAHGVLDNGGFTLDTKVPTLAKILKSHGYSTSAFVSAFVLDSLWRLDQGFDYYSDRLNRSDKEDHSMGEMQRRAEESALEAGQWLEENSHKRFFCWVHFYDPHEPYDPPEPFHSNYSANLYDGEIAYTDHVIGNLLDRIRKLHVDENTLIIVTADHGEGLGEHNEATHSVFLYNSTLHVPLLIHLPGSDGSRRIPQTVNHMDLAPTLLDWLGIAVPMEMQGRSLIPILEGKDKTDRTVLSISAFAELHYGWSPLRSIIAENYKYIDAPKPELYEIDEDPREQNNLVEEKQPLAKVLKERLAESFNKNTTAVRGPEKMDPEIEEKLRALGYIGATVVSTPESRKIDPKDKIHVMQGVREALKALLDKDYEKTERVAAAILNEDPNIPDAHFALGAAYLATGQYEKSIDELLITLTLRPNHTDTIHQLGVAHQKTGNYQEAEKWYLKVLQYEDRLPTEMKLAFLYKEMNQPEKAKPYFLKCIRSYEDTLSALRAPQERSNILATLGELYFGAGDLDTAADRYQEALRLTPAEQYLHYNLAQIFEMQGAVVEAISHYEKELVVSSSSYESLNNLGLLYRKTDNWERSTVCFEKALQLHNSPLTAYLLAENYSRANIRLNEALRFAQTYVAQNPQYTKGHALVASIQQRITQNAQAPEVNQ